MTEKKDNRARNTIAKGLKSFHMEASRCASGMSMLLSGIIGVADFSQESILLLSHGGRIVIEGKGLSVCVFEHSSVEIVGKIEEIKFKYGKN